MPAILRLHACVPDENRPEVSHAWLSLEKDGITTTYGMQPKGGDHVPPDQRNATTSAGEETQLVVNGDSHWADRGRVLREQTLDDKQEASFRAWTDQPHEFQQSKNNCAHGARDGWKAGTGEHFDVEHQVAPKWNPDIQLTYECPAGLAASVAKGPSNAASSMQVDADFDRPPPPAAPELEPLELSETKGKGKLTLNGRGAVA